MRYLTVLAFLGGCYDEGWVLPEADAIVIVREELSAVGVAAADSTRTIDGIEVCLAEAPCRMVTVALDGWDEAAQVGFAYLSARDRGAPSSVAEERDEAEAIQAALDAREDGIILVFREFAHETEGLARDQFRRVVQSALAERGLDG